MSVFDHEIAGLDGNPLDLAQFKGKATLVVNVASRCGLTPQYADLEQLHEHVEWNFEKFLISPAGEVVARFRPQTKPQSAEVIAAVESVLPASA